jgi:hypothetical protein
VTASPATPRWLLHATDEALLEQGIALFETRALVRID